jgi:hypothetical protein
MNVFVSFLLVGVGISASVAHNYICREREKKAYLRGYNQAKREEKIKQEAMERGRFQEWYGGNFTSSNNTKPNKVVDIPECFVEEFKKNKRAIAVIK